ncbi:MAG: hypothetical protein M3O46_06685 [Myxococcota bacterium]|nr:hypothetical protein [Myxococcota bacterium]
MTFRSGVLLALAWSALSACARAPGPPPSERGPADATLIAMATSDARASLSAASAAASDLRSASAPASTADASAPADSAALSADGKDFIAQAQTLFRVAACGTTGDVPTRFDAAVVARHCDALSRAYGEYQRAWVDVAKPFIASLRPKDLPSVVVYPFGGGDLASALATFPDATEITTISLEPAGDIRPIDTLPAFLLDRELAVHRSHLERLFEKAHSRTDNLEKESKTELPGEVLFALAALVVHGDEPVSLRYFRLGPDGSIAYVTQADIDAAKTPNDRHALLASAELRFRKAGIADAPVRVLRHISFNLDDFHLKADGSLLAYLSPKGKIAAMTKAASHLLWSDHFALIRRWLLDHTDWMISDSTGIPPRFATPAGFIQDTFGTFNGPAPFGLLDDRDAADVRKLFAAQKGRDPGFRYGYPDKDGHGHIIVTRRGPDAEPTVGSEPYDGSQ